MIIKQTERLIIEHFTPDDDTFILALLNTPSWIAFIGDRSIKTKEDAGRYLKDRLIKSYTDKGFGFYITRLKSNNEPIGTCGLVKRDSLDIIDIGFAFLPEYEGKGYGYESSDAILTFAKNELKLLRIAAITNKENERSIGLLKKLGLHFQKMIILPSETEEIMLFEKTL